MSDTVKRVLWTAVEAFVGAFIPLAVGMSQYHNYAEVKAAVLALIPAAIAAAVSAAKNVVLAPGHTAR